MHLLMRLVEISLIPFSCILIKSCLPRSSIKLTLVRSMSRSDGLDEACSQHLASSSTHAPESFPSMTSRVTADSLLQVILINSRGMRDGQVQSVFPMTTEPDAGFARRQAVPLFLRRNRSGEATSER